MEGTGPVAIVTGSSTGIGYQTALGLALKGYTVVIATRNRQAARDAVLRIKREVEKRSHSTESKSFLDGGSVHTGTATDMLLDTSSLASVKSFADGFPPSLASRLHVLVLNAGISGLGLAREERKTVDSHERVFATNFLGHFYLAQQMLESLKLTASAAPSFTHGRPPVRIVTLASVTHRLVPSDPPDWNAVLTGMSKKGSQYAYSKLAALLLAGELNRGPLVGSGVTAIAVNPGAVNSDIWRNITACTACWFRPFMRLTFLTPEQGAATSIAAASESKLGSTPLDSPNVEHTPTLYLSPYASPQWMQRAGGWTALVGDLLGLFRGANVMLPTPLSLDAKCAKALWLACETAIAAKQGL